MEQIGISTKKRRVHKVVPLSEILQRPYLKASEACRVIGISRSKFEVLRADGRFEVHKLGGSIFVKRADIEALFPKDFISC
jgi:excisionase family DNA binding protein